MSQGTPSYITLPPDDTGKKVRTWIVSGEHIEVVTIADVSGHIVSVGDGLPVKLDSGALVVTPITSGSVIVSGTVSTSVSGNVVIAKVSGESVTIVSSEVSITSAVFQTSVSGNVLSLASGNEIIWRTPLAETITIFSGYGTTNTLVYSGYSTVTRAKSTIHIYNLTNGSSISYTIRGATLSGSLIYSLTSGTLASGQSLVTTLTDPYSWVDVGVANLQSNFSGAVTVSVVTR